MNELERRIAAAKPAGPSADLDARVRQALSGARASRPTAEPRRRGTGTLASACAASALVAATIGFLAGRQTVAVGLTADSRTDQVVSPAPHARETGAVANLAEPPNVTTVPLPDDRLAGLFVRRGTREGLLGAGPVTIEISTTP